LLCSFGVVGMESAGTLCPIRGSNGTGVSTPGDSVGSNVGASSGVGLAVASGLLLLASVEQKGDGDRTEC